MAKYINDKRLTDDIIKDMLGKCGLELITSRYDEMKGETVAINPILRNEENIIISCRNKETLEMAKSVFKRFPMLGYFSRGVYEVGDEIVSLDDFFAQRLKIVDELDELDQKLFDTYHETMCGLFGEGYQKDAKECFDKLVAEESNKKEETSLDKDNVNVSEMGE